MVIASMKHHIAEYTHPIPYHLNKQKQIVSSTILYITIINLTEIGKERIIIFIRFLSVKSFDVEESNKINRVNLSLRTIALNGFPRYYEWNFHDETTSGKRGKVRCRIQSSNDSCLDSSV